MLNVFAVRDVKAECFGSLMVLPTRGLAIRSFTDACRDARSPMAQYPSDYSLYELGTYDDVSGQIVSHSVPVFLAAASDFVQHVPSSEQPVPVVESVPEVKA